MGAGFVWMAIGDTSWFATLGKMSMAPSAMLVYIGTLLLYVCSGLALFMVMRTGVTLREKLGAYVYYVLAWGLNIAWVWLFFGTTNGVVATMVILVSILVAGWAASSMRMVNKNAGWFMYGYAVILAFVAYLNILTVFAGYRLGNLVNIVSTLL